MQINADVQMNLEADGLTFRMLAPLVESRLVPSYEA
jgi:hypothetical protein